MHNFFKMKQENLNNAALNSDWALKTFWDIELEDDFLKKVESLR